MPLPWVDAKGPESVVITGPEFDQPIELMDTADIDLMSRLMEQSGIWYGTGDLPKPLAKQPGELGPAYTLTWVNGGPPGKSVAERTIRQFIYLDAERGPMIHTPAQKTLENWGPGVIGWFTASDHLPDTLAKLGVPLDEQVADQSLSTYQFDRTFWYFAAAGLAIIIGLAVKVGARRLRA